MAETLVKFKRGTKAEIEAIPNENGSLLLETDQGDFNKLYNDLEDGTRVAIGGRTDITLLEQELEDMKDPNLDGSLQNQIGDTSKPNLPLPNQSVVDNIINLPNKRLIRQTTLSTPEELVDVQNEGFLRVYCRYFQGSRTIASVIYHGEPDVEVRIYASSLMNGELASDVTSQIPVYPGDKVKLIQKTANGGELARLYEFGY